MARPVGVRRLRTAFALIGLLALAIATAATTTTVSTPEGAAAGDAAEPGPARRPVYRTDGVEGRMDTYASQVSEAHIWDLEVVGTTVYVAGKFTSVVEAGGSWPRRDQPFLAAFDTRTGDWRSGWRPRVDRPVYALDTLPSGAVVAAGEFTRANGGVAEGIVALDPRTGATDRRFVAGVSRPGSDRYAVVRDLHLRGNDLYAVGHFGQVSGAGSAPLAVDQAVRLDATTGAPDPSWRPALVGRSAWAVAVSADGRRVHLGGEFSSVNGVRGTSQLATVSTRNGALVRGWDHGSNATAWPVWPVGGVVFDLDVYRDKLFLTGAEHFWELRDSRTGRSIRFQHITNDGQTVEVAGDRVYIGCHCFHRDPAHQVWEVDAATGRPYPGRTAALQSGDGTWATAVAEDGCLWLGGDFSSATAVAGLGTGSFWVGRLARLCPPGGPEGAAAPEPRPGPVNPPWWRTPAEP